MSRPRCFECGKQLMYVAGKPVFAVYVDPIGVEHKLHKDCFKHCEYTNKPVNVQATDSKRLEVV